MNTPDIVGICLVILGVLILIPTVFITGWFFLAVGLFVGAGIVFIIEAGEMCRYHSAAKIKEIKERDEPDKDLPPLTETKV
tara:strand:+ start:1632 stop:1874 length:243 start_codon:yes stop_codon:yes gene_type:complete